MMTMSLKSFINDVIKLIVSPMKFEVIPQQGTTKEATGTMVAGLLDECYTAIQGTIQGTIQGIRQ